MSERRATGDTLILPFTVGLLIGGMVAGWICLGLGLEENLLGLSLGGTGDCLSWSMGVALSVVFGSLLELGVLKLISVLLRFPLTLRLSSVSLVILGIAAASASTIASCLTIDLGPHPENHFYKGPNPPFPHYVLAICAIAPLLLVKRAKSPMDEADSETVAPTQMAEDGTQTPFRNNEADGKDAE